MSDKDKKVLVILDGKLYKMGERMAKDLISLAIESFKGTGKNVIVALKYKELYEMVKFEFDDVDKMQEVMSQYNDLDIEAYYATAQ